MIWAKWGISRKASVKVINAQAEFRTKHSWIQVRSITALTYILGPLQYSNILVVEPTILQYRLQKDQQMLKEAVDFFK
jgi:hypothetical protein